MRVALHAALLLCKVARDVAVLHGEVCCVAADYTLPWIGSLCAAMPGHSCMLVSIIECYHMYTCVCQLLLASSSSNRRCVRAGTESECYRILAGALTDAACAGGCRCCEGLLPSGSSTFCGFREDIDSVIVSAWLRVRETWRADYQESPEMCKLV